MKRWAMYGLTEQEWVEIQERAGRRCEACAQPCEQLQIDHDHDAGHVRGLLCQPCNQLLGRIDRENADAPPYLTTYLAAASNRPRVGRYRPTPVRKFRVPDDVWRRAQAAAATEGRTLSAVILGVLEDYIA